MTNNRIRAKDIHKLGRIVFVGAHPDDETMLAGGILALASKNGQHTATITVTKGEAGIQDEDKWPSSKLGQIRTKELEQALKILGVSEHYWLDCKDGCCKDTDKTDKIAQLLMKIRPDTILTFGPDGITGHDDHVAVGKWTKQAIKQLAFKPDLYLAVVPQDKYDKYLSLADEKINIFFNIDKPLIKPAEECDIDCVVDGDACIKKCDALAEMPSQMTKLFKNFGKDFVKKAWAREVFIKSK